MDTSAAAGRHDVLENARPARPASPQEKRRIADNGAIIAPPGEIAPGIPGDQPAGLTGSSCIAARPRA